MTDKLKVLDLFSGIGGFSLGLEWTGGFETVAFCEIEKFPQKVLRKHWPDVKVYEDVRKLSRTNGPDAVDVICGGYPCQPFSVAGKRQGAEDDRHLWPEVARLLDEYRPRWFIGENVAGHVSLGLDQVLSDLEGQGYTARSFIIPACAVDAPHRRDRVWVLAHAGNEGIHQRRLPNDAQRESGEPRGVVGHGLPSRAKFQREALANSNCTGLQGWAQARKTGSIRPRRNQFLERRANLPGRIWPPEPPVGRVAHGIPRRVDRLKALGNAVVPQIPELIGYAILEAEAACMEEAA